MTKMTHAEAVGTLRAMIERGGPRPHLTNEGLGLHTVKINEAVFQHRRPSAPASARHIAELTKVLRRRNAKPLEAIDVIWDGYNFVCVDGHHRLAAYACAGWTAPVPVRVFEGGLDEAVAFAVRNNSRNRLSMEDSERLDAAWRMVCSGSYSKTAISEDANVSEGSVANMRRAWAKLTAKQRQRAAELSWADARRMAEGQKGTQGEFDPDAEAREMANKLAMVFGKRKLTYDTVVFAKAIEIYDRSARRRLLDWWAGNAEEEDECGDSDPEMQGSDAPPVAHEADF